MNLKLLTLTISERSFRGLTVSSLLLILSLLLGGCSNHSQTSEEDSVSEMIDKLVSTVKGGEELNQEDRNKIYDLATYLNQKYKGGMKSDEVIEVYSEN